MTRSTDIAGRAATADAIAAQLTEAVHEHRVLPGMKLNEDEVGEIFGAGRTVVRQALRALAHSGLVTIERNRGAFVTQPSVKEAREVFEARALLEPQTARAAATRTTADSLALLEDHIEREHAALDAGKAGLALKLSGPISCRDCPHRRSGHDRGFHPRSGLTLLFGDRPVLAAAELRCAKAMPITRSWRRCGDKMPAPPRT